MNNAQRRHIISHLKYDVPVYIVVAVIAALSPNNKWSRNVVNADALIGAFVNGDGIDSVKVSTYHKMKQKAWDILAARPSYNGAKDMLKGQKITSFFMDIMGEFNVTMTATHGPDKHWRREYRALR